MKNTVWVCSLVIVMIATGFTTTAALAEPDNKDAKREIHHLQAQLSVAQKEKAELAAQVDELKKQVSGLGSKSAALEKKSGGERKQVAELTDKYQEADRNLQQMTELYSEINQSQQQLQSDNEQEHKRLEGSIQKCEKKNAELYQLSVFMMEKYQSKGIVSAMLQAEPFTQIEKVRVQNLLQEYRDKADAAKIATHSTPTPSSNIEPVNVSAVVPAGDASDHVQDVLHP